MSSSNKKPKRRPPGEKPTDSKDADWGFASGADDLGVEKKLIIVLTFCLICAFGFVFYAKYQKLKQDGLLAKDETPDVLTPTLGDETFSATSLALVSSQESASPTSAISSPFYEAPPSPTPAPDADPSPTLTRETPDDWSLTPTSLAQTTPQQPVSTPTPTSVVEDFDPFAVTEPTLLTQDSSPTDSSPTESMPTESAPPQEEPSPTFARESPPADTGWADLSADPTAEPFPMAESTTIESTPIESMATSSEREPHEPTDPLNLFAADDEEPTLGEPQLPASLPEMRQPDLSQQATAPSSQPTNVSDPFVFADPNSPTSSDPGSSASSPLPQMPVAQSPTNLNATTPEPTTPAWPFDETATATPPASSEPPLLSFDQVASPAPTPVTTSTLSSVPTLTPETTTRSHVRSLPPANPFDAGSLRPSPTMPALSPSQAVFGEREITISPSDSFWSISQREYGSSRYFTALAQYNRDRVAQPDQLRSGMTIKLPPPEILESQFPQLFRRSPRRDGNISPISATDETGFFLDTHRQPRYRVGERDTLSSIAQQHLGRSSRWTVLFDLNRDRLKSPSTLKIGMVLRLPDNASQVTIAPASASSR